MTSSRNLLFLGLVYLVGAVAAAYLATEQPKVGMLAAGGLVGIHLLRMLNVGLIDLLVVTSPFMFFPPFARLLNVAVSDAILPLLAISVALAYSGVNGESIADAARTRGPRAFAVGLLAILALVTLRAALFDPDFERSLALIDLMKLTVVLSYFVVFAAALLLLDRNRLIRLMQLWVWLAVAQSAGSVAGILPSDGYRSLGFFQDPNLYAGYLLVTLTISFTLVSLEHLPFWPVAVALMGGGILSTASRGGILATVIVISVAVLGVAFTRLGVLITVGIAGLLSSLLLLPWRDWLVRIPGGGRLLDSSQATSSDPRFDLWHRAIDLWSDHPIAGIGIGQFPRFSAGLTPFQGGDEGQVAHNTFLSLAVEAGLLGLFVFVAGLIYLAVRIVNAEWIRWSTRWSIFLGLIAVGSMMMTVNLQNLRYVWMFAALAWVLTDSKNRSVRDLHRPRTLVSDQPSTHPGS